MLGEFLGLLFSVIGTSKLSHVPAGFDAERYGIMLTCFGPDLVDAGSFTLGVLQLTCGATLLLRRVIFGARAQRTASIVASGLLVCTMVVGIRCQTMSDAGTSLVVAWALGTLSVILFARELLTRSSGHRGL